VPAGADEAFTSRTTAEEVACKEVAARIDNVRAVIFSGRAQCPLLADFVAKVVDDLGED
jgi:3'-phosphoadenosine 5'-phosphosulfate sulfotransferase (PAPS reductase)/FAD synthetase